MILLLRVKFNIRDTVYVIIIPVYILSGISEVIFNFSDDRVIRGRFVGLEKKFHALLIVIAIFCFLSKEYIFIC